MKIKVCGMKIPDNIEQLSKLNIDFMGFIFYKKSKRYTKTIAIDITKNKKKVGVFVNENIDNLIDITIQNNLHYVQLHGDETVEYCKKLKEQKIKIIKAFRIEDNFDFELTNKYQDFCDYFVFDTKGKNYGGNGVKFNWHLLDNYKGTTPFLLSGGIALEDCDSLKKFNHSKFIGVDINSKFEIDAGLKNIEEIEKFIENINGIRN